MLFCTGVDVRDLITPGNFGSHRFRRFRMAGVRISGFSIDFHRRPYRPNTLALPCQRVIGAQRTFTSVRILIRRARLNGECLLNESDETRHRKLGKGIGKHEMSPILPHKRLQTGSPFYPPYVNSACYAIADGDQQTELNQTLPNGGR